MKRVKTQGIAYIEPLDGSRGAWYWGTDYASGDLYEAQELFRDGHPVRSNRLLFVHYPDGRVVEPVAAKEGQYFGRPIFYEGKIHILMVDFPAGEIKIARYDDTLDRTAPVAEVPLSAVKDCYNLMLETSPLMLARHGMEDSFQLIWPERVSFPIGERESFLFREGERLYFSAWQDEPEYHEEVLVRRMDTGEIVERIPGTLKFMPDGQRWLLT
ncbi:MAG: hypothetical protein HFF21_09555 [Oscillospiraceae bacterium]|nr:hypothetical protein [Oscillospiraceae bacterium]